VEARIQWEESNVENSARGYRTKSDLWQSTTLAKVPIMHMLKVTAKTATFSKATHEQTVENGV
jgi:hypothetical protein